MAYNICKLGSCRPAIGEGTVHTPRNIVIGHRVSAEKVQRVKELRSNQTEAEALLWQGLRTNRLDGWHFRRQQIIQGFLVDFYCHRAGLVIEVDGPIHEQQAAADREREQVLQECGLRVIRFTNRQILAELPEVLCTIRKALGSLPKT
jgi:very-short-patch-repair endonuclease